MCGAEFLLIPQTRFDWRRLWSPVELFLTLGVVVVEDVFLHGSPSADHLLLGICLYVTPYTLKPMRGWTVESEPGARFSFSSGYGGPLFFSAGFELADAGPLPFEKPIPVVHRCLVSAGEDLFFIEVGGGQSNLFFLTPCHSFEILAGWSF